MAASFDDAHDTVWRASVAGRFWAVACVACWLALVAGATAGGAPGGEVALLWLSLAAVAVGAWRWSFVPFVALTDSGVVVQNPFRRTTLAYADIATASSGSYGLTITRRSGGSVAVWAVQKSGRRRRQAKSESPADEVAKAIGTRAGLDV